MRFALLGDHPDGLEMARALAESGRHEIAVYCGPVVGNEFLQRWNLAVKRIGDMEEMLAYPQLDAVIVAGSAADRGAQLRRALQSEHHVLCVHPADASADIAYEAEMIRKDTGKLLLPILPDGLHPAFARVAELIRAGEAGGIRFLQIERREVEQVLLEADDVGQKPSFPGWDILRALGGDIGELLAFAEADYAAADQPILVSGRFVDGGLFQVNLLPNQAEARLTITVATRYRRFELRFPQGFPGNARLVWTDDAGAEREEHWPEWNPWPEMVAAFERRLHPARPGDSMQPANVESPVVEEHVTAERHLRPAPAGGQRRLTWRDEVRCLELDAAARRSLEHRRASTLDFQEVTEEASFKGTMTLVGCGLLWASLVLLIFSIWLPWLGWFILPLFGVFLLLQTLRLLMPPEAQTKSATQSRRSGG